MVPAETNLVLSATAPAVPLLSVGVTPSNQTVATPRQGGMVSPTQEIHATPSSHHMGIRSGALKSDMATASSPEMSRDQVGDILAFALQAALEGGPALATVLKVGIAGARENMLTSPESVGAYLAVCDTTLRLIQAPRPQDVSEFNRLLKDVESCAKGISRASRRAQIKKSWLDVVERVHELRLQWAGNEDAVESQ